MKLARRLGTMTLISAITITNLPVVTMAQTQVPIEETINESVSIEESVEESLSEVENRNEIVTYAVNDQAAVDAAKRAVQDQIDQTKTFVQKDYTYKTWKALQDVLKEAEALLTATFDNGAGQKFEYVDHEGNRQRLSESEYIAQLNHETTGVARKIQDKIQGMHKIKDFTDKLEEVKQLESSDFKPILTNNSTLGLTGEKTLDQLVAKAEEMLRQLLVDSADDSLFEQIGTSSDADKMMKYLVDITKESNRSNQKAFLDLLAKCEEIVINQKDVYTLKSYNALKTAYEAAKAIKPEEATTSDIENLSNGSSAPYDVLVSLETVQIELAKVDALLSQKNDYTADSWKASQDKIATAAANVEKALNDATFEYSKSDVTRDAEDVLKAISEVKDASNAEGNLLVSIKALKEAVQQAKPLKTGEDKDYTPTSLKKYNEAIQKAELMLAKANIISLDAPDSATVWDEINHESTGIFTKVQTDALGMKKESAGWVANPDAGLVNIQAAKVLVEENKDLLGASSQAELLDYVFDTNWESYVNLVNALKTEITTNEASATPKTVKTKSDDVLKAKEKLIKVSHTNFKDLIAKAEKEVMHKDFYAQSPEQTSQFAKLEEAIQTAKQVTMPSAAHMKALASALDEVMALPYFTEAQATREAISAAHSILNTKTFMASSKKALEANLKAAEALMDTYEMDKEKLTAATASLNIASSKSGKYGEYFEASKDGLSAYIDDAETIPSSSFKDEDFARFVEALNAAKKVAGELSPSPEKCEEAFELLKAAVEKTAHNREALERLYHEAKAYKDYMFKDTNWSGLDTLLSDAKAALNSTDSKAVNEAYIALKAKVELLQKDAINKDTLQKYITEATKDLREYDYTAVSWARLQNTIEQAKELLEGSEETSLAIKTMQEETLKNAVTVSPTGLVLYTTPKASVDDLLAAKYYKLNQEAYLFTAASWEAYVVVRDRFANELLTVVDEETMPTTDAAKAATYVNRAESLVKLQKDLFKAFEGLVKVNGESLTELVAEAEKLVEKEYTKESWAKLTKALEDAKAALEEGVPSVMVSAEKALRTAIGGLVEVEKSPAQFTKDLFENVMGRPASEKDVEYYTNLLATNKNWTAAVLVKHFTTTDEFTSKNLDEEGYIKALYKMAFNREADANGLAYWKAEMAKEGRQMTTARILASKEFDDYCQANQVTTGELTVNAPAQNFIKGIYTATLGRSARPAEVLSWLGKLENKTQTGSGVVKAFLASPEFTSKNVSDEEYVNVLYKACFGGVDKKGAAYWTAQIKEGKKTRKEALNFFTSCEQFKKICANANIEM